MNANKEAEYIAEIVRLRSLLSKVNGKDSIETINAILASIADESCAFTFEIDQPETLTVADGYTPHFKRKLVRPARLSAYKEVSEKINFTMQGE